jgi:hypothetical protein
MTTVFQAIRAAQNAIACPILAANDYVLGSVGGFVPGLNQPALAAINALRRLYGCPEDDDVEAVPPFSGGQCPVNYTVTVAGPPSPTGGPGTATRTVLGPVGGMCFPFISAVPPRVQIGVSGANGCNTGGGGQGIVATSFSGDWGIVSAVRQDGQPDNCGDPPIDYPPPTNFTTNTDITYNVDNGDEVTITVPFVYAPITANFDGTLRIPFTFDLGGFEFSGDINLLPDLEVSINPPTVPRAPEINPGDFDPIPGEEVDPLPPDEKIIGVVVNVIEADGRRVSSIFSPDIPAILAPRAGSVKFAYSFGGATFWSSDIDIKGTRTFIDCPFSQGADAVIASPQTGVELTFVPIKGSPLATVRDLRQPS